MSWPYYGDPRPDIQRLVTAPGRRFLDVGCGEGALSAALRAAGAEHVAGIELEPRAAAQARDRVDVLVEGDVTAVDLPFELNEFDYLLFGDVLEHVPDPDAVLERLLPYLKDDGRVVVSVPNMRFYPVLLRLVVDRWAYTDAGVRDRTHLRIFTRRTLERMLDRRGLSLERMERNYRLLEDQSEIGRLGAVATRVARRTVGPLLFRDLMAFQYIAVARRKDGVARRSPRVE
jgi:2-polyprenyl-3-methyl-5-hydroxy-6-metoxy-1,4-benzoquinol methylase